MQSMVALGVVNAGKSSLLSALADTPNLFLSGDVPRVTRDVQSESRSGLLLVDTPGLDATEADVELAFEIATSARIIMWCHSLRRGELCVHEINALKKFRQMNLLWRTCFVLTHGDDVASYEVIRLVSKRIAEQLGEVFGMRFVGVGEPYVQPVGGQRNPRPFNVTGAAEYWRGRRGSGPEAERRMVRSGIPRLRQFLQSLKVEGHP